MLFTLHFSLFTALGWMHGDTLEFVSASTPSPRLSEQSITPDSTPKPPPPSVGHTPPSSGANSHYIRGPRGCCYYISPSGGKVYSTEVCVIKS